MSANETGQSFEVAQTAVDLMKDHNIPVSPKSFTVWYNYAEGEHQELKRSVDLGVKAGQVMTENECLALYDKYFGNDGVEGEINAVGEKIALELDHMISSLSSAGTHTEAYGQALAKVTTQFGTSNELGDLPTPLKSVLEQVVSATNQMRDRTQALERRLDESRVEVQSLRTDLESIRQESITDALTGLGNRRYFDQILRTLATEALDTEEPLSLILGDIDHFKKFNDTFGHQTGDQVLKLVGACIRENVKGRDQAARYGGEEFAIVLPQTQVDGGRALAESIREAVQGKRLVKRSTGEDLGTITVSFGIAQFRPGETLGEIVERADICLYAAKRAGRNCTRTEKQVDLAEVEAESNASKGEQKAS